MHLIGKKILDNFLPFLKFRRKNLKWYQIFLILIETLIMLWVVYWIFILKFYNYSFSSDYKVHQLLFYKHSSINCFESQKLDYKIMTIYDTLSKHNIDLKKLNANIFFVNNDYEYYMVMPPLNIINYYYTMAFTTLDNIYIKRVNLYNNKSYLDEKEENSESLELVLSHELIHVWQEKNYGLVRFLLLSDWVKEGYAVYVTEHFNKDKINFLNNDFNNYDKRDWYKLWGLIVKYAIEKMHKSIDDLHLGKVDYDEVLDSLLREYNITKQ